MSAVDGIAAGLGVELTPLADRRAEARRMEARRLARRMRKVYDRDWAPRPCDRPDCGEIHPWRDECPSRVRARAERHARREARRLAREQEVAR